MRQEPMFLNPVIRAKTYYVYDRYGDEIGQVNASDVNEAYRNAREQYREARTVVLKKNETRTDS